MIPSPKKWFEVEQFVKEGGYSSQLQTCFGEQDLDKIIPIVQSNEEHIRWIRKWAIAAKLKPDPVTLTIDIIIHIFLKIAWYIHHDNKLVARTILTKALRHKMNRLARSRATADTKLLVPEEGCDNDEHPPLEGQSSSEEQSKNADVSGGLVSETSAAFPQSSHVAVSGFGRFDSPLSSLPDTDAEDGHEKVFDTLDDRLIPLRKSSRTTRQDYTQFYDPRPYWEKVKEEDGEREESSTEKAFMARRWIKRGVTAQKKSATRSSTPAKDIRMINLRKYKNKDKMSHQTTGSSHRLTRSQTLSRKTHNEQSAKEALLVTESEARLLHHSNTAPLPNTLADNMKNKRALGGVTELAQRKYSLAPHSTHPKRTRNGEQSPESVSETHDEEPPTKRHRRFGSPVIAEPTYEAIFVPQERPESPELMRDGLMDTEVPVPSSPLKPHMNSDDTLVEPYSKPNEEMDILTTEDVNDTEPETSHPSPRTSAPAWSENAVQPCNDTFPNFEPPWRTQSPEDLPSQPSYARPPSSADTHSWSFAKPASLAPLNFPPPLAENIYANAKAFKPKLNVNPPVWAQSRQELCESLSYFRAYQGGVYSHKKTAHGYLLDGHPAKQDIWYADGRSIISHGGGHSAVDKETKQTMLVEDQTARSISCAALHRTWKSQQPIVLIAGDGYNLFPFNLEGRSYVVLGYYLITHAWEEPEPSSASPRGYFVRWKFLFQWLEFQGDPWWIPARVSPPSPQATINFSPQTSNATDPHPVCETCLRLSPKIYAFGWVCTHSECSAFFRLLSNNRTPSSGYQSSFLTPSKDVVKYKGMGLDIRPKRPVDPIQSGSWEHGQDGTSRLHWKGFWCEKCGRLSCREYWTHWECLSCQDTYRIDFAIQPVPKDTGKTFGHPSEDSGITKRIRALASTGEPFMCQSYNLPHNRGTIHIVRATRSTLKVADKIWYQYQEDARDNGFFKRYSMKTHKLKGRMLSHYFSQNSGAPYAYVGGTNNTVPLDTYVSVKQAMNLIRGKASQVLGYDPEFNEILSAAYMADQKMDFHSDGEKDLGPVVASLSLGSSATMRFRPVPSRWTASDSGAASQRKSPPILLTLTLRHGDVLLMEGAEIQEYYQHAVHPWGFRIAATARFIKFESSNG